MTKIISERFSFKGYSLWTWFKGNYKTIKEVAKLGLPLWAALSTTWSPTTVVLATALGKFALDALEYFVKEYKA